ncbi:MAG TPA: hypothetical protein VK623_06105 [Flavobacterium sp.]|nr:hypothetical protein [Flavobacterium sp.]
MDYTYKYWALFLNFLADISWPVLIMLIVIFFEEQIRYLIKNTKKVNVGGGSIEIQNSQQTQTEATTLDAEILDIESNDELYEYLREFTESSQEIVKASILRDSKIVIETGENFNRLLTYSMLLYFEKHFQNVYRLIYGSQIEILYKIDGNDNETKDSLKYIYENAVAKSPNSYAEYSYGQYLQFMESYALIYIAENNNVKITDQGRDFLTFIERVNLPKTKSFY